MIHNTDWSQINCHVSKQCGYGLCKGSLSRIRMCWVPWAWTQNWTRVHLLWEEGWQLQLLERIHYLKGVKSRVRGMGVKNQHCSGHCPPQAIEQSLRTVPGEWWVVGTWGAPWRWGNYSPEVADFLKKMTNFPRTRNSLLRLTLPSHLPTC